MTGDDMENLRKFSICADQFGDGMTIVPQELLAKAHAEISRLRDVLNWSEENCPGKCAGPIRAALACG